MLGFLIALLSGLFKALKAVFSKTGLGKMDEYILAWTLRFFAALMLLPLLFFFDIPKLGEHFWITLIIDGILMSINTIIYLKAIKSSDISLTMPMISFTPLFLLVTSPIMIGEFPSLFGLIGVLLIVAGSYALNINQRHHGYLEPFKILTRDRGVMLMLLVAFIWSIIPNFDKIGINNSSPIFWSFAIEAMTALILFPLALYKSARNFRIIPKKMKHLLPVSFASAAEVLTSVLAINLVLVVYAISIKRLSILMAVIFGYLFFKEKNIKERLTGAIIMVIGVLFITLFN